MYHYQAGFGNHFSTEALPNTLPVGQNAPQQVAHGLYAEQLTGSSFTAPRKHNLRSWLYRIRPSALQGEYRAYSQPQLQSSPFNAITSPTPLRWDPLPIPTTPIDFIDSLQTWAGHGDLTTHTGAAVHLYAFNQSMTERFFYNADGEFLFIPEQSTLLLHTELGTLAVAPGEIAVIPRGIKYQVATTGPARGYVCENYGTPLMLPELGPIGANGLANPRDFLAPVARYEDREGDFEVLCKFQGALWTTHMSHSPLDVVAWHGNYAPYKYNLAHFNTINTVSFDHPDPSIFTVLTSPSLLAGTANLDFVIFPERWMVAEHTFRPPYYHRNIMSEFMGLIYGTYDAKETGFVPGGSSLHNCMTPHGPDQAAFEKATHAELKPAYYGGTLAFMLESHAVWRPTANAMQSNTRQQDYVTCWQELKKYFQPG